MLFLPAVDFGNGPKIGAASWQFAVTATSEHQDGANAFIEFALQDKYFTAFSDGIGLIPPTKSAAAESKYYSEGAPMVVFYDLAEQQGTLRPVTPGYVVQSRVFQKAASDIADGAEPAAALDAAVDEIDADIEANQGYGHTTGG
jgi:multiple sugar transport system substrate-binding protein